MERLTKRDFVFNSHYVANKLQSWSIAQCLKKLQEYENAEEDGRILVLPCKLGDKVYRIYYNCTLPGDCGTKRMCKGCEYRNTYIEEDRFRLDMLNGFGKFGHPYYITREEAEQALKEEEE